jgi:sugar/nucleoside kinase (ribokinase family)
MARRDRSAARRPDSSAGDAVVAGHLCLDIIPALDAGPLVFAPGSLVEIGPAVLATGGVVSNTGLALHRLGVRTRLVGKVGDDRFGRLVRELVAGAGPGLAAGLVEAPGETTSYTIILSPRGADRMFLHCAGCNDTFGAGDVDYGRLASARVLHFGYPPAMRRMCRDDGDELAEILRRARAAGVTTSLDMTMPDLGSFAGRIDWRVLLDRVLPFVDLFLPSLDEIVFMLRGRPLERRDARPEALEEVARELVALGPAVVGLKLGGLGLYLRTGGAASWADRGRAAPRALAPWLDRQLWSPCFEVDVAGTTGAGDATIAGFLAALLRGHAPEECATLACAVGGCSVEAADAVSGVRSWRATRRRVAGGWRRRALPEPATGWRRDPIRGLLVGPEDGVRMNAATRGRTRRQQSPRPRPDNDL